MTIYRLLPDNQGDWARFELFEQRVRRFLRKYLPETPEVLAIQQLRMRWVQSPLDTGLWLAIDERGRSRGHLAAHTEFCYGQPFVLFWQMEIDHVVETSIEAAEESGWQMISRIGHEVVQWIEAYNRILAAQGRQERITYGESHTWIEPKVYERLFRDSGMLLKDHRHLYRWTLPPSPNEEAAKAAQDYPAIYPPKPLMN